MTKEKGRRETDDRICFWLDKADKAALEAIADELGRIGVAAIMRQMAKRYIAEYEADRIRTKAELEKRSRFVGSDESGNPVYKKDERPTDK